MNATNCSQTRKRQQTPVTPECCSMAHLCGKQVWSYNTTSSQSTLVVGARAYRF